MAVAALPVIGRGGSGRIGAGSESRFFVEQFVPIVADPAIEIFAVRARANASGLRFHGKAISTWQTREVNMDR